MALCDRVSFSLLHRTKSAKSMTDFQGAFYRDEAVAQGKKIQVQQPLYG